MTLFNIGVGTASVVFALQGRFVDSAGLILISALFDSLDGYIARRLKSTSKTGEYLDTISDFIAFGIATPILMWMAFDVAAPIAVIFCIASFSRLWMFMNADTKALFYGVPTTACGSLLSSMVLASSQATKWGVTLHGLPHWALDVFMLILSALMVSKVRYCKIYLKSKKVKVLFMFLLSTIFIFSMAFFLKAMFLLSMAYILFGWMPLRKGKACIS